MARKVKTPSIDVSGLSIEDIMGIPFEMLNTLNRRDLAKITSRLASTANKRIKRLLNSDYGEVSRALESIINRVKKSGTTAFSVKGKDVNQLRNEFAQVKNFLNLKTSSVVGTKKVINKTLERLGVDRSNWSNAKNKRFFKIYRKLVEEYGGNDEKFKEWYDSKNIQRVLSEKFKWKNKDDDILDIMRKHLNGLYEDKERTDNELDDDYNDIFG